MHLLFFLPDLHCCDKAGDLKCRDSCKKILKIKTTGQEIVDGLQEGGCGPPLPQVIKTYDVENALRLHF